MERIPVKSSQISAIGHDPIENVLEVEFSSGGLYRYLGVTAEDHIALIGAESIGSHFGQKVKGKFPTLKYDPAKKAFGQLERTRSSSKQRGMIVGLAKKLGWIEGNSRDRIGVLWRRIEPVIGRAVPDGATVDAFLTDLWADEASKLIEWMKAETE